ncbi:hypothetical protein DL770_010114 [Monosporascus sp. CRB-9-2]|nr:hypothetical protein DL770_010114 [Monosporascus sp. CRB-9-2]
MEDATTERSEVIIEQLKGIRSCEGRKFFDLVDELESYDSAAAYDMREWYYNFHEPPGDEIPPLDSSSVRLTAAVLLSLNFSYHQTFPVTKTPGEQPQEKESLKLDLDLVSGVTSPDEAARTHHNTTRTILKGEDPSGNPTAAGVAAYSRPLWPCSHPRVCKARSPPRLIRESAPPCDEDGPWQDSGCPLTPAPQDFYDCNATTAVAVSPAPSHVSEARFPGRRQRQREGRAGAVNKDAIIGATSKLKNPKPKKGEAAQARVENWDFTSTPLTDEERARNGRVKGLDPAKQKETAPERTAFGAKEQPTEALVLYGAGVVTKDGVLLPPMPSLSCHIFFASSVAPLRKELIAERHLVPPPDVNAGSLYPGDGIIDGWRGVDVTVRVEGHTATEYADPDVPAPGNAGDCKTGSQYIECKDKAKFTIHLKATKDYAWRHRNYSLNIVIFIDGEYPKGELCRKGDTLFHVVGTRCWRSHHPGPHRRGSDSLDPLLGTSCHAGDALIFPIINTRPLVAKKQDGRLRLKSTVSPINETTPLIHPTGNEFPSTIASLASGLGRGALRESLQPAETADDAGSGGARGGRGSLSGANSDPGGTQDLFGAFVTDNPRACHGKYGRRARYRQHFPITITSPITNPSLLERQVNPEDEGPLPQGKHLHCPRSVRCQCRGATGRSTGHSSDFELKQWLNLNPNADDDVFEDNNESSF